MLPEGLITSLTGEELEVSAEELADEDSCFIECEGLKVHYKVAQPQVKPVRNLNLSNTSDDKSHAVTLLLDLQTILQIAGNNILQTKMPNCWVKKDFPS